MDFYYKNAVTLAKYVIKDKLKSGDIAVDATCGNGYDSVLLSTIVGREGKIYCFDVQEDAIKLTEEKLINESALNNWVLIHDGHENLDKYISFNVNAAIFNLGYLPKGNHEIITTPENTISAIQKLMDRLVPGGIIVIVSYYGHKGGYEEMSKLSVFVKSIDNKKYTVIKSEFVNQINCPPMLITIEKSYRQDL